MKPRIPLALTGIYLTDATVNAVWMKACLSGKSLEDALVDCVLALMEEKRALLNQLIEVSANSPLPTWKVKP